MSYRNTRGNKGRYGTRSNTDAYSPAYTTQAGYQPNNQNSSPQPQFNQRSQQATAVKQEYETPQMKRDGFQADNTVSSPPTPTTTTTTTSPQTAPKAPVEPVPAETPMVQDGDDKSADKPWKKRTFQKLPKKVKKKRLNAKLRNLLAPKNAMMVLHELHPGLSCTTNEENTSTGQSSYTVVIDIDGKQFKGQGLSKAQAKQTACENALKAALFEKMAQGNVQKPAEVEIAQEMDTTETDSTVGANGESAEGKSRKPPEEDDVPWGSLASYALFKLFSEWQAQGYTLPTANKIQQQPSPPANHTMMPMKKMPPDANQRHPVQLLNQLRPQAQYLETREGNPPNMVFTFTVTFDGQTFTGVGPNKKDSKKTCAKNALISMGIQYDD